MKNKSRKKTYSVSTQPPKIGRKGNIPAFLRVPVPPEVARWHRGGAQCEPYRQISQARAVEITGKSSHTVKRWANGRQAIDSSSLRLLQVWVFGIIPDPAFIEAGIFLAHQQRWHHTYTGTPQTLIATDNGYLITPADLQSFGWLKSHYWQQLEALQQAAPAPTLPLAVVVPFLEARARLRPTPPADPAAGKDLA